MYSVLRSDMQVPLNIQWNMSPAGLHPAPTVTIFNDKRRLDPGDGEALTRDELWAKYDWGQHWDELRGYTSKEFESYWESLQEEEEEEEEEEEGSHLLSAQKPPINENIEGVACSELASRLVFCVEDYGHVMHNDFRNSVKAVAKCVVENGAVGIFVVTDPLHLRKLEE